MQIFEKDQRSVPEEVPFPAECTQPSTLKKSPTECEAIQTDRDALIFVQRLNPLHHAGASDIPARVSVAPLEE